MTHEQQVRRLKKLIKYWTPIMGLQDWELLSQFMDGEYFTADGERSRNANATAHARWQYMQATLGFNTQLTATLDDERCEYTVVHEMCHILVNELRIVPENMHWTNEDLEHEERVCTQLAWSFIRAAHKQATAPSHALGTTQKPANLAQLPKPQKEVPRRRPTSK